MKRLAATIVALALLAGNARAFDLLTPKGIGLGRTLVLSQPSATTLLALPFEALKPGGWQLEGGYNRRFELADLDQVFLAAAYRAHGFSFAVGASQFGKTDLYAEQLLKGSVTFQYKRFSFGPSLSAMQVQIGDGYGTLRAATFGLGLSAAWTKITAGFAADNLTRPSLVDGSAPIEPVYSLYSELRGRGSFTVNARATWQSKQDPQFAVGQTVRLSERGTFFWGVAFNPLEYGGGIELKIASGSLSYATSVHPVLGFSHTVSFSYGSPVKRRPTEGNDGFD